MDQIKRKTGRPRLGKEKKDARTIMSSTKEEKASVEQNAASVKMSASMFLLHLGLHKKIRPPIPPVNRKTFLEINAVGRNLNTLVVLLQLNKKFDHSAIFATLEDLQKQLDKIRAQLIGKGAYEEADEAEKDEVLKELSIAQNTESKAEQKSEFVM